MACVKDNWVGFPCGCAECNVPPPEEECIKDRKNLFDFGCGCKKCSQPAPPPPSRKRKRSPSPSPPPRSVLAKIDANAPAKQSAKTLEFIAKARKVHGNRWGYSKVEYKNSKTDVVIICRRHNREFPQTPSSHLVGSGCPICRYEKSSDVNRKNQTTALVDFRRVHGEMYDYSRVLYVDDKTNVSIICRRCDQEFPQSPNNHLRGHGCPICGREKMAKAKRKDQTTALTGFRRVHGEMYDYSKVLYVDNKTNVIIICRRCDREFPQSPGAHLSGQGCPSCLHKSELLARSIIERLTGLPFTKAHPVWLEGLELDGFCERIRLAFERQGEQHSKKISKFFHRKEGSFEAQLERDARKRKLCIEHGMTLFEIPHIYNCTNPKKMEAFIRGWLDDHGYIKSTQTKIHISRPADPVLASELAARTLQELADRESILAELEVVPFVILAPHKESKRATPPAVSNRKPAPNRPCQVCIDLKACPFIARITGNQCLKCQVALCEHCKQRLNNKCQRCQ
jgi:hypothetical protein